MNNTYTPYEFDEFICHSLLAAELALADGRLKKGTGAVNAFLLRRLTAQLQLKDGSQLLQRELQGIVRSVEEQKRVFPRAQDRWVNLHKLFEQKNERYQEARARFRAMPATDLLCVDAVRQKLEEDGYLCHFGADLSGPVDHRDKMVIILKEHLEESFDPSGSLMLPCTIITCGRIQPVIDAFYGYGFLLFMREQKNVDGFVCSHMFMDPNMPVHKALPPSKERLAAM